jgi:hypothetical protein
VLRQRTGYGNGGDDPNSHSSYCGQSFRCGQSFDRAAAIEVASGHATHVAVATAAHMTHVAHSAAANAAVVATHSTAAKVKPASATTAASATHATTASALHELEHAGGRFEVKSGAGFYRQLRRGQ